MAETIDFSIENETHFFKPRESIHPSEILKNVIVRFVAANRGTYRLLGEEATHLFTYGYLQREDDTPEHVELFRQWSLIVPDGAVFKSIETGENKSREIIIPNIFGLELGRPIGWRSSDKYLPQ